MAMSVGTKARALPTPPRAKIKLKPNDSSAIVSSMITRSYRLFDLERYAKMINPPFVHPLQTMGQVSVSSSFQTSPVG